MSQFVELKKTDRFDAASLNIEGVDEADTQAFRVETLKLITGTERTASVVRSRCSLTDGLTLVHDTTWFANEPIHVR